MAPAISRFESLANELVFEIFDYLSCIDILTGFAHLNKRLATLVASRSLHIDLSHLSKTQFDQFNSLLPHHQIVSLKLSNKWTINGIDRFIFNSIRRQQSSMDNLRILILVHIGYNDLCLIMKHLKLISHLHTFKIQSTHFDGLDRERIHVLKQIFIEMNQLRICQIPLIDVNDLDDLIPNRTIEQLTIDYCTMACLTRLFHYIPDVQHLSVRIFTDLQNLSPIVRRQCSHSNLRSFQLSTTNNIPFNQFENLFIHTTDDNHFSRLEHFSFSFKTQAASQSCLDYVDDKRWQGILESFVSLEQFICCLELPINTESIAKRISSSFAQNPFFRTRNWKFAVDAYTFSFNTILRVHTRPYLRRRLDTIPLQMPVDSAAYCRVRDLHLLIDKIPRTNRIGSSSTAAYPSVTSLTLTANKSFDEQAFMTYLHSAIRPFLLHNLTIQLDDCSKVLLIHLIQFLPQLRSLSISTHHVWSKLIAVSSLIGKSRIRSLTVYESFVPFHQYEHVHQLFGQLENLAVSVATMDDGYRLLTLLFIGNRTKTVPNLWSLSIKCDFEEPDAIAYWLRTNIARKLSYKCTTNLLTIWF